jgi:alpha-methylacyl-CoA racemase
MTTGPLHGVRVIEIAGIGPGPFAGMMLADMGADVIRVDRAVAGGLGATFPPDKDILIRGRRSIAVDLKSPEGIELVLSLIDGADAVFEGFRPGVMERMGLGPDVCLGRNPKLVYGRMTGWGQDGPWAQMAGHDLDYIALAGALHPMGARDAVPPVPLNLIGDFGGGGMFLAFGMVCALVEAGRSGKGQVVDAAMVDGTAALTAMFHGMLAMGLWQPQREGNLLDGGAPFYRCYRCADGEFIAVGALEPQFYAELLRGLELDADAWPQFDFARWDDMREAFGKRIGERTRDEWAAVFDGTDACVAPVLALGEAPAHPHLAERGVFVEFAGIRQPAPAPRFSRTSPSLSRPPVLPGQHTDEILSELGLEADRIAALRTAATIK